MYYTISVILNTYILPIHIYIYIYIYIYIIPICIYIVPTYVYIIKIYNAGSESGQQRDHGADPGAGTPDETQEALAPQEQAPLAPARAPQTLVLLPYYFQA